MFINAATFHAAIIKLIFQAEEMKFILSSTEQLCIQTQFVVLR